MKTYVTGGIWSISAVALLSGVTVLLCGDGGGLPRTAGATYPIGGELPSTDGSAYPVGGGLSTTAGSAYPVGGGSPPMTAGAAHPGGHQYKMCEEVRVNCAFEPGCSLAMHNYFTKCEKSLFADPTKCPGPCVEALVALTSTQHGKHLMDCTCRDAFCVEMKARVEVCRPMVIETAKNETVVSCELAQLICMVDPVCTAALGYYQTFCKRMMQGLACTERCLNSVEILQRQEKASKMNRCSCAGPAAVECLRNKEHMVRLCYNMGGDGPHQHHGNKSGGNRKNRKKHKLKLFDADPDRAEVETMIADPNYVPGNWREYSDGGKGSASGGRGSASGVRSAGVPFALAVAAAVHLVTRTSRF